MKDLQHYLESLTDIELMQLTTLMDEKPMKEETALFITETIQKIHKAETMEPIKGTSANDWIEKMEKHFENFSVSLALFYNVRKGTLLITSGRLKLINSTAKLSMTPKGKAYVENNLLPK